MPEWSGWSSPGCRDRQGAASEHLLPRLTILTTLVTLTAMILSTILGMIHRHDRRNHSCTMLGMITRTIFWTFRTITTTTHRHYSRDDPRQPSKMIHRHDHQNHSRADHHDGAPGTIPMTIRPSFPRRSSETISEPARTSIRNQPDQGSHDRVAGVAVFVGVGGTGRARAAGTAGDKIRRVTKPESDQDDADDGVLSAGKILSRDAKRYRRQDRRAATIWVWSEGII